MSIFLDWLRRGASHEEAARAAGFNRASFFRLRKRDPGFAALWEAAVEQSAGCRFVNPGVGRRLQLRRNRSLRFTDARRQLFLEHFAGTCNLTDAAAAARISEGTIFATRARDPEFAADFQAALEQGYARLEADVLRRRVEAQQRLRTIAPAGEPEPEFERALKLLQRWERRDGTLGPRTRTPGRGRRWTFDEAIEALDKKLEALGVRRRREREQGEG